MKNTLKQINLLQRLVERINSEFVDLNYTLLADYFVKNFDHLETLTIEKICQDNYVSKSTVTRFCRNIGYNNLTELKQSKSITNSKNNNENLSVSDLSNAFNNLEISMRDIEYIVNEIKNHEYVFILFPSNLAFSAYDFQQRLLSYQKIIYLLPNIDNQIHLINQQLVNSCIVVLDSNKEYTSSIIKYLDTIHADIILISNVNTQPSIKNYYQVLLNNSQNNSLIEKYLYSFYLDQIYLNYKNV